MPDGVTVNESAVLAGAPVTAAGARTRLVRRLLRNRSVVIGGSVFLLLVLVALFADALSPYNPTRLYPAQRLKAPSMQNLLGTDEGQGFAQLIRGPEHVAGDAAEAFTEIHLQSERCQADEHTDAHSAQAAKEQNATERQEQCCQVMFQLDATHKWLA